MSNLANILNVARREFGVRVWTRSFVLGTLLLVLGVAIIAFLPVIIRYLDRSDTEKVAVYVAAPDLPTDPVLTLTALLNPTAANDPAKSNTPPDFSVSKVTDLAAARDATERGEYGAVLSIERPSGGD